MDGVVVCIAQKHSICSAGRPGVASMPYCVEPCSKETPSLPGQPLTCPPGAPSHPTPGRYGFNPGSALMILDGASAIVARVCATTTLSAAAGGLSTLFTQMASRSEGTFIQLYSVRAPFRLPQLTACSEACTPDRTQQGHWQHSSHSALYTLPLCPCSSFSTRRTARSFGISWSRQMVSWQASVPTGRWGVREEWCCWCLCVRVHAM